MNKIKDNIYQWLFAFGMVFEVLTPAIHNEEWRAVLIDGFKDVVRDNWSKYRGR